ncbi:MAG: DUF2321 domain-containing protein [Candidatus Pacebacteria bacterium]|nr:DUF2321 domain-containing protein [Candidatus Paceibacterota bacterium]
MEGYDVAQICQNGHVVNSGFTDYPQHNQSFCQHCGSATITKCPDCNASIRGYYRGTMTLGYSAPSFCINCGHPYPWTTAKLQAAHELAQEIENISDEDRIVLQKSIDELVKDSPSTPVAATRFKKIMVKVGQTTAGMFREILVDVLSEAAKKALFS